jgi:hypothetical protein
MLTEARCAIIRSKYSDLLRRLPHVALSGEQQLLMSAVESHLRAMSVITPDTAIDYSQVAELTCRVIEEFNLPVD